LLIIVKMSGTDMYVLCLERSPARATRAPSGAVPALMAEMMRRWAGQILIHTLAAMMVPRCRRGGCRPRAGEDLVQADDEARGEDERDGGADGLLLLERLPQEVVDDPAGDEGAETMPWPMPMACRCRADEHAALGGADHIDEDEEEDAGDPVYARPSGTNRGRAA
jgi:hypothetical protein